jgi:hypothetical protein
MEELDLLISEDVKCVIAILAIEMVNLISSNWKYVRSGYVADLRLCFDVAVNLSLISTGYSFQIVI